jgi:8-oxo-dGTP diphosphatase
VNLYLVRHAHAGDREHWDGPDDERPLSPRGYEQTDALTAAFATSPIGRVLTSPAVRCRQTVEPLAARLGVAVEPTLVLAEGSPVEPAVSLMVALASDGHDAVLCMHGDLLPEMVRALEHRGTTVDGVGCAKGSVWHVVANDKRFMRATYHRTPDPSITHID